jgi:hypothetical protein
LPQNENLRFMGVQNLVMQAGTPAHPTKCYNLWTQKGNRTLEIRQVEAVTRAERKQLNCSGTLSTVHRRSPLAHQALAGELDAIEAA